MLKGHVFKFQTFANEVFAHFMNTLLQGNMGITKGCNLSKTNNSVTISEGYFCVMGRFLEIVGNETISDITNTGYYQLICEIDLSKINTTSELNQAVIKLVRSTSGYSNLIKEDLFEGGNIYQYEFARFRVTETGITEFTDRRTFLNLESLYSQINSNFNNLFNAKDQQAEVLLEEIRQELSNIIDGSAYVLKTEIKTVTAELRIQYGTGIIEIDYPIGFNIDNSCIVSHSIKYENETIRKEYNDQYVYCQLRQNSIFFAYINEHQASDDTIYNRAIEIVLMKKW